MGKSDANTHHAHTRAHATYICTLKQSFSQTHGMHANVQRFSHLHEVWVAEEWEQRAALCEGLGRSTTLLIVTLVHGGVLSRIEEEGER